MRSFWPLLLLLALGVGLGQRLVLPEGAVAGGPLTLSGEGLPDGRYPLALEGPGGTRVEEVEVQGGRFALPLTLEAPGEYRVRLNLPSGALEGRFLLLAPTPPELTPEGLKLPWGLLPLPPGPWVGPLVEGERVYVAQGLLVVEAGLKEEAVRYHFAPAKVLALRPGPEALLEGERVLPIPFPPVPFQGKEEDLKALRPLLLALNPPRPWPYFAYWALPPETLSEEDLAAYGQDLRARGHRPELPFGQEGVLRMAEAARALLGEDPARAKALTLALLRYTPLFPGSEAFFREMAEALEAQGEVATALRLREALALSAPWRPPDLGFLAPAFFVLGTAYLALFLYLFLFYLPAQLKDLRPIGGYLGGFFRHPLLRLRHLHLAYAGLGERLLALLLFLATLAALLLYGLDAKARAALWAPPLDQGTLFTPAAQEWARSLPPTPGAKALQGYTLLRDNPTQARALLREGAPLPFALALLGEKELVLAYEKAPWSGPVRSLLGLGADPWGPREPAPTLRTLYTLLLEAEARRLAEDPWRGFSQLPLPLPEGYRAWAFAALLLLALYHLLTFFLPRRQGQPSPAYALFLRLLLPGSLGLGGGLGVVLLLLAAYGLWALLQGSSYLYLAAAYGLHLLLVLSSRAWRRA